MSKKIILFLAGSIIALGMCVSFRQYLHTAIDGDIVPIVLPMETYATVLHDPFGFDAIANNKQYSGAGRYFIHLTLNFLFRQGFSFINKFLNDPIESLYVTAAIFQWFCHWLLILVFGLYANIARKFSVIYFLGACALSIPFFPFANCCYNTTLIDSAITYTAFYAFPLALLMLFYYPLLREIFYDEHAPTSSLTTKILLPVLGAFLIFSGPLIPVLGILLSLLTIILFLLKNKSESSMLGLKDLVRNLKSAPFTIRVMLPLCMILWLYAFYIGKYNMENTTEVSVLERYRLMFSSLTFYFFNGGLPYFFVLILINFALIISFHSYVLRSRNFRYVIIFGIAIFFYILLLPLGGYRGYRPMILRYDVTMPLTIYLIVIIIAGIPFMLNNLKSMYRMIYAVLITCILVVFWSKNFPLQDSRREQQLMLTILRGTHSDTIVSLPYSSNFFSWEKIDAPEKSYYVRQMLYVWGITDRQVIFYQK